MSYDLVLFDLDGTLIDTAPDIADAVNRVLADRRLPAMREAWIRDRIGFGTRALLEAAAGAAVGAAVGAPSGATGVRRSLVAAKAAPTVEELLDEFAETYTHYCGRRGRLYPGAAAVLASLRSAGVKLAVLTNKEQRFARFVLEVHGLDGDFDLLVCGDSLAAKKPDALPVRHCLTVLGVAPERALLVGDSDVDVQTARSAGIAVWAANYGYNQGRPIGQARPDRVIGRLAEVLEPFAEKLAAMGRSYDAPRASSSSRYLRSNPRN